jgi:hypothetical protein
VPGARCQVPGARCQVPGFGLPASELRRQFELFEESPDWVASKRIIIRMAQTYQMRDQAEDVVSEVRLLVFQSLLRPKPIPHLRAYAKKVARSVVRKMLRKLPRAEGDIAELLTTELPTRIPFDTLTARTPFDELAKKVPVDRPQFRGKIQNRIESTICSGSNLESLSGDDPDRLATLKFDTNEMTARIKKWRENRGESQSADST